MSGLRMCVLLTVEETFLIFCNTNAAPSTAPAGIRKPHIVLFQRTHTVGGRITVLQVAGLTRLDLTDKEKSCFCMQWTSWIQTSKTGDQLYCDTSHNGECSLVNQSYIIDIVSNLVFWSQKMNKLVLLHINNFCQQWQKPLLFTWLTDSNFLG